LWVAQERGFFAKNGLEVLLVLTRLSQPAIAGLLAGELQMVYGGANAALGAASNGAELKLVAAMSNRLTYELIARPGINKTEELRGKRFGIQNPGGTTWINTVLALEHVGLEPKRDNINLLPIGDSVLVGQALEAGRVDAAMQDGALVRRLSNKGFAIIAELQPAKIPLLSQAIVVAPEFLQKRGDIAEKLLMTLVESLAYSMAPMNKAVVIKTMMRKFQITDPAVAEEGYHDYLNGVERRPIPTPDGMRNIRRLMATLNPKIANVKVEDLIDSRLIRKLDENGFIDKMAANYGLK